MIKELKVKHKIQVIKMQGFWIKWLCDIYIILTMLLISSCSIHKNSNSYKEQPIEFNLKVINAFDDEPSFIEYRALYYEIKNNTGVDIYFNIMNFSETIKDTNGTTYYEGYFKTLSGAERYKNGCTHCSLGLDFDIYPLNRNDTLNNIVKINAHSSFSDTLRAYGYNFLHDQEGKKESLPYCFKKDAKNKNKIEFQLLYDNTMQDARADTIWKGKLISKVAVWE